jgi:hypothetical protein
VEVELAYRTGLAERLDLISQPKHMRFASVGGVTSADLEIAYNKVVTAEASSELLNDLIKRDFWGDFLREQQAEKFTELFEPFLQRVNAATESMEALGARYRAQVDGIADEKQQAENGLLKSLTEEAMKTDESKTCFILD